MSNYQAKKVKNKETRAKVALGFKTILKNDACVRASRELGWLAPIIIVLCSIALALLPNLVNSLGVDYGSTIIEQAGYGIETGLTAFGDKANEKDLKLKVQAGYMTDVNSWVEMQESSEVKWFQHTNTVTTKKDLEVFYNNSTSNDKNFIDDVLANKNPYTGADRGNWNLAPASETGEYSYACSVVIFGQDTFFIQTFNNEGKAGFSTYYGAKYDRLGEGFMVKSLCKSKTEIPGLLDRITDTRNNYKSFISNVFESYKLESAWGYTGIMAAVYSGMVILLGLVLFLVTRGKKNPFRIITFFETQKIGYWASFTPAVLALVLGFIIRGTLGQFLFIFLFGMRTMWLSMRTLRPDAIQ